jgi:hypothetical protein
LPSVQYNAREVRNGALSWAFAERRSAAASSVLASRIPQHLGRGGILSRDLVWQAENGGEFKGDFAKVQGDNQPVRFQPMRIPPSAHTCRSDVETVHRLAEVEFFDLETFSRRREILAKAHTDRL